MPGDPRRQEAPRPRFSLTRYTERARTVGPPVHDAQVSEKQPLSDPCVFDRMLAASLSIERIEQHLTAGLVRLDGQLVTDPHTPAPPGTSIALALP